MRPRHDSISQSLRTTAFVVFDSTAEAAQLNCNRDTLRIVLLLFENPFPFAYSLFLNGGA
jgi:hypothetical protein